MSFDFYLPAFPDIGAQFGVPISAVQLTLSVSLLGVALGQLIVGPLTDRFGRRPPTMIGLSIFILASIGCALSPTIGWLLFFRIVQALGGCAGFVASRAMTRDLYQGPALAKALSMIFLIFGIAPVLSPALGVALLTFLPWQSLFWVLSVYGVLCFAGVFFMSETHPVNKRTDHGFTQALRAYRTVLRNPIVLLSSLVAALAGAALFSFISLSPAVFLTYFGLAQSQFVLVFGGICIALFGMSQVNVRLLRRFQVRPLLARMVTIQAVFGLALLAAAIAGVGLGIFVLLLGATVCCTGAINPNSAASALEPFPALAGTAAAVIGCLQMLGGSVASSVLSTLSLPATVTVSLGISATATVAAFLAWRLVRLA